MESGIWLGLFVCIFMLYEQHQNTVLHHVLRRAKHRKGTKIMNDLLQRFVGKECIITTVNNLSGSQITGVVKAVEGNWLAVQSGKQDQNINMINADYIMRIREYPRGKSGKKKSLVVD